MSEDSSYVREELRHFRGFLRALTLLSTLDGAVYLLAGFLFHQRVLVIAGTTLFAAFALQAIAWRLAMQERLATASLVLGYTLLLMTFINGPLFTVVAPTLAILPFVAVTVVLPHARGRALALFLIVTVAAEMSVAGFAVLFPGRPSLPPLWKVLFSTHSMSAISTLVLVLLLQYRARVRRALERSKEAVRARDEFISIASHELLTPLTPLTLNAAALMRAKKHVPPPPVGSVSGKIENIDRQIRRLSRLINELLDISRIASHRMVLELSRVDLGAVSREVLLGNQAELARSGCAVSLHVDPQGIQGEWDRHRLEQVLWNLLSNAAKFGAGKPIEISVSASEGVAAVRVRDHGIGISPQDQLRIFEQFERAVSTQHYGGFGLGLWISRVIVESMGGSIWVQSKPGQGSTFGLRLPQSQAAPFASIG